MNRMADETMGQFSGYDTMQSQHEAGIAARERVYWEKRALQKQAGRDRELKRQISDSLAATEKVFRALGITHPKGLEVIIYGLHQNIADEHSGAKDKTDLDTKADEDRANGSLVIEVQADTLAQVGNFSEPSSSGIHALTDAVLKVTSNGSGDMAVDIVAFSRGGSSAITFSMDLVDPYMGKLTERIRDPQVSVTVERSTGFHAINLAVNIGAFFLGLGHREVYKSGGNTGRLAPDYYDLPHVRMDSCVSSGGALSGC